MSLLLFIIALIAVVYGILAIVRGDVLIGIALLIVAALVGPGGYSLFQR